MAEKLLEIENMTTAFFTGKKWIKATDRISLSVDKGQTLCIVGESGSGKSVTSLSIMRLIDFAGGAVMEGTIKYKGENLLDKTQKQMREIRGNQIAMIFQDPMSSLNPVFTVGEQIAESIRIHKKKSKAEAAQEAIELLRLVGIPSPEIRAKQYPHQLSGGMSQRVVIAIALACSPDLLIADEPTTALDVTVQAQILELLQNLKDELGMGIILITHDIGVAAEMSDRVAVMYAGVIVEEGNSADLFRQPAHPYTSGLLRSIPGIEGDRDEDLYTIKGSIPPIGNLPGGCRFNPRCPYAMDICKQIEPGKYTVEEGHEVACYLYDKEVMKDKPLGFITIEREGE